MLNNNFYIVSTPIGNLGDITIRAILVLKSVDIIVCENINKCKILLDKYNINKRLILYNNSNERIKSRIILKYIIKYKKKVALISSAGTPVLNDPGYYLINEAYKYNIKVVSVPGCSSLIAALSLSGLKVDSFIFLGFLPNSNENKANLLRKYIGSNIILVFYESCCRVLSTLKYMFDFFDNCKRIVIIKEITKIYEKIFKGSIKYVYDIFKNNNSQIKGEFVIILYSHIIKKDIILISYKEMDIFHLLLKNLSIKKSIFIITRFVNIDKKFLYNYAIKYKKTFLNFKE